MFRAAFLMTLVSLLPAMAAEPMTVGVSADVLVGMSRTTDKAQVLAVCGGQGEAERVSYLRFPLAGIDAGADKVMLRLDVAAASSPSVRVALHPVASWDGKPPSWEDRPDVEGRIARSGITGDGVVEFDITAAVRAQVAAGADVVDFALVGASNTSEDWIEVYSRDMTPTMGPKLVVSQSAASTMQAGR